MLIGRPAEVVPVSIKCALSEPPSTSRPQVPVVVRACLNDRAQSLGVAMQALDHAVHLDMLVDKLVELIEAVFVATLQVAVVDRLQFRTLSRHEQASFQL